MCAREKERKRAGERESKGGFTGRTQEINNNSIAKTTATKAPTVQNYCININTDHNQAYIQTRVL